MGRATPKPSVAHRLEAQALSLGRKALEAALSDRDKAALALAEASPLDIPGPASRLAARLYRPGALPADAGLLVFFHGGGFAFCDRGTHDALCRRLAHGAGVAILSVDYRLAPEHAWPAQREDARAAARWALERRAALPGPSGPLILGGDSAGAYLALDAARRLNAERSGTVSLTCLIYPLLHLDDALWAGAAVVSRPIGRAAVRWIGRSLCESPPNLLDADASDDPPCVLTYGGVADPVAPDCLAYEAALAVAGVPVDVQVFKALPHGYANLTHLLPAARRAIDATATLLSRAVRRA